MSGDNTENRFTTTVGDLVGEENYPPPPPKGPFTAPEDDDHHPVSLQEDITDFAVLEDDELEEVERTEWGLPSEEPKKPLGTWLRGIVVIAGLILLICSVVFLGDINFQKTPTKTFAHQETAVATQWATMVSPDSSSLQSEVVPEFEPEIEGVTTVNLESFGASSDLSLAAFDLAHLALPDGVTSTLLVDTFDSANKPAKATAAKRSVHRKKKQVASKKRKGALRSKRVSSRATIRKKPKKQPSVARRAPMQIAQVSQKPCEKKLLYACATKLFKASRKESRYLRYSDCKQSCISTNCQRF